MWDAGCGMLRGSRCCRRCLIQQSPGRLRRRTRAMWGKSKSRAGARGCARLWGRQGGDRGSRAPGLPSPRAPAEGRGGGSGGRQGGREADRSPSAVTFHSFKCLGFLQISSGFPGAFLFFSTYRGLQPVLADPRACTKYHCCQPDLQVCAGIVTGLGLEASLGDFLPLFSDVRARRRPRLQEAFSAGALQQQRALVLAGERGCTTPLSASGPQSCGSVSYQCNELPQSPGSAPL